MPAPETLLIIAPVTPPPVWLDELSRKVPGIEIHVHPGEMFAKDTPETVPADLWPKVTALFTWTAFPPRELVPNLQFVQLYSAGCEHVLGLSLFEDTDIAFCTSSGVQAPQIAEWVFATFLSFQHRLLKHLDNQRLSRWVNCETDERTEDALGLRVGILGYGSVGRQCARVARVFGMQVVAHTLRERPTAASRRDERGFTEIGMGDAEGVLPAKWYHGQEQLNDFLGSDLDLLVITVPQTPQTIDMIGSEQFSLLAKKRAFVSNVGRGAVVNTDALISALDHGLIRGAALDVTEPEPLPADSKLWSYSNVVITPHCSAISRHLIERIFQVLSTNLERRARGEPVLNRVSRVLRY